MEWHGLQDMRPKPLTTPKRYGAGMAHTVASIGHVLSCCYCELLWITMDYRLSWTMMEYRGVSWIIVDYDGLIMDYGELPWIMDYHGLSWIKRAYHGLRAIMEYCGLLWHIMDYRGLLWMFKYAPPWNRMDYKISTPSL